jgi:hypothetical protein
LLRVEAEKRPDTDRHLVIADAPEPRSADDDGDLLLPGVGLVVLVTDGAGRELEPVEPNASTPSSRRTKRTAPAGPAAWTSSA